MFHYNDNSHQLDHITDAVLVGAWTYQVIRFICNDSQTCFEYSKGNELLNLFDETVVIVTCPMGKYPTRQFWIYYSTFNYYTLILFMETASPYSEGTNLAFADYYQAPIKNPIIPDNVFDVSRRCNKTIHDYAEFFGFDNNVTTTTATTQTGIATSTTNQVDTSTTSIDTTESEDGSHFVRPYLNYIIMIVMISINFICLRLFYLNCI